MSADTPSIKLYTALLAAQRAFGPLFKNTLNPHLKSKYADLGAVLDTIEQPLWDNGLIIVQRFASDQGNPILITELIHAESGQAISGAVPVVSKDATDPQKIGAAITYYRRYSLLALLGLAPEDDDGHSASQPPRRDQQPAAPYNGFNGTANRPAPPARTTPPAAQPVADQSIPFNQFPKQPPYAPQKAVAAEIAMRDAEPLSPPQYEHMLNEAWVMVEDGKSKPDVWQYIHGHRPRMTEAQWSDVNATHWKQMGKKIAERDQALAALAPPAPRPASYAG